MEKYSEGNLPSSEHEIARINKKSLQRGLISKAAFSAIEKLFIYFGKLKKTKNALSILEEIISENFDGLPDSYKTLEKNVPLSERIEPLLLYILEKKIEFIEKNHGEIDRDLKMNILNNKSFIELDKYGEGLSDECESQISLTNENVITIM